MSQLKKYRLLMHGRNYLIDCDGKPQKCEFYQNIFLESNSLKQAELLTTIKLIKNKELKSLTLNRKDDPPRVNLETYWELDSFSYVGNYLETDRTFYEEKKWWQFWK